MNDMIDTVICGDCLDVMREMPDNSVDLCVTSPPYNQKIDSFKPSGMHKESSWVSTISAGYKDSKDESAYILEQIAVIREIYRILKDSGSLFYNHKIRWRDGLLLHPIDIIRQVPEFRLRQEIVWARNGSCTFNAKMFAPNDERIYWMVKGGHKWNQKYVSYFTVWQIPSRCDKNHPCAFPIEIPRRAINAVTDVGDVVLDCYAGSGTVLQAACDLQRHFIGIEINPDYCKIAEKRIQKERDKYALFGEQQ